jgi:hypothetical protein
MAKKCYRSFTITSLSMVFILMSSCGQSQRKDENESTNKTPREILGFYTEQEGSLPGSQPTIPWAA